MCLCCVPTVYVYVRVYSTCVYEQVCVAHVNVCVCLLPADVSLLLRKGASLQYALIMFWMTTRILCSVTYDAYSSSIAEKTGLRYMEGGREGGREGVSWQITHSFYCKVYTCTGKVHMEKFMHMYTYM